MTSPKRVRADRDRAAELERVSITVNRGEWDALHATRERTEIALATHESLRRSFAGLLDTNAIQLDRLTRLTMETEHLRACLNRVEERERQLTARVKQLEADLAVAVQTAASADAAASKKYETLLAARGVRP